VVTLTNEVNLQLDITTNLIGIDMKEQRTGRKQYLKSDDEIFILDSVALYPELLTDLSNLGVEIDEDLEDLVETDLIREYPIYSTSGVMDSKGRDKDRNLVTKVTEDLIKGLTQLGYKDVSGYEYLEIISGTNTEYQTNLYGFKYSEVDDKVLENFEIALDQFLPDNNEIMIKGLVNGGELYYLVKVTPSKFSGDADEISDFMQEWSKVLL
jgi:hypothetical protein